MRLSFELLIVPIQSVASRHYLHSAKIFPVNNFCLEMIHQNKIMNEYARRYATIKKQRRAQSFAEGRLICFIYLIIFHTAICAFIAG